MANPKWNVSTWAYYLGVVAGGGFFLGSSLTSGEALFTPDFCWVFLVIPLILLRNTFIQLPNRDARICPSGVFVLYAAIAWGPEPGAVMAAIEASLNSYDQSIERWRRLSFNVAALSMSLYLASIAGFRAVPREISRTVLEVFSRALLIGLLYFVLSASLVVGMMIVAGGVRALKTAQSTLLWSWVEYLAGAVVAGLIAAIEGQVSIALALGVLAWSLTHLALKYYFGVLRARNMAVEELHAAHLATLGTLATAIEAKDPVTHGHAVRVHALADALGRALRMTDKDLDSLRISALLHDIGKLAIPEYLLYQNGGINPEDLRVFRSHATLGAEILEHSRLHDDVKRWVRHHHERYDGSGYPYGLAGSEIPYGARVLSVANTFDNLKYPRGAAEVPTEKALEALKAEAGRGLDPQVVDYLRAHPEINGSLDGAADIEGKEDVASSKTDLRQASFVKKFRMSHKEARALYTLSTNIRGAETLEPRLAHLLESIREIVPFGAAAVYLPERTTRDLERVYASGCSLVTDGTWPTQKWLTQCRKWIDTGGEFIERASCPRPCLPVGEGEQQEGEQQEGECTRALFRLVLEHDERGLVLFCHAPPMEYSEDVRRIIHSFIEFATPSISDAREYQKFQHESLTDALTGLWNQRALRQNGPEFIANVIRRAENGCVVAIDLNGFKQVNDTLGHHEGDRLLVEVAREMKAHVRGSDLVARNGGDEFVLIMTGISPTALAERLERLYRTTCSLWPEGMDTGRRGISYGCCWFPADGKDLETLMIRADKYMYQDKQRKKAGRTS